MSENKSLPLMELKYSDSSFQPVKGLAKEMDLRLFYLPEGAVLGCFVKIFDSDVPYSFHYSFDISNQTTKEYLSDIAKSPQMLLVFKYRDKELFSEIMPVKSGELEKLIADGERFNKSLPKVEGALAVEKFRTVFRQYFPKSGTTGSWNAVEEYFRINPSAQPAKHGVSGTKSVLSFIGVLLAVILASGFGSWLIAIYWQGAWNIITAIVCFIMLLALFISRRMVLNAQDNKERALGCFMSLYVVIVFAAWFAMGLYGQGKS